MALFLADGIAQAAEIKILSAGTTEEPLKHIATDFTRATGHHVAFTIDTVGALQTKLKAAGQADVVILSVAGIEALQKDNVLPAGRTDLARVLIGVGVRDGGALPD